MDLYGDVRFYMDLYGDVRFYMDLYGDLRLCFTWTSMEMGGSVFSLLWDL